MSLPEIEKFIGRKIPTEQINYDSLMPVRTPPSKTKTSRPKNLHLATKNATNKQRRQRKNKQKKN